jgi:23S rRNA (cytosine1962-C5)-methyltransferase
VSSESFIFLQKPHGWSTHSPSAENPFHLGIHEWAQNLLQEKLFVCHRLDRETSGLIVMAKSAEAAKIIGEKFEKHEIQKTYYFISKSHSRETKFDHSSLIEKVGNQFVSSQKDPNAHTHFEKIKSLADFELWRATPKTGKPHQIRLHAQDLGIVVLGDSVHGGAPFSRMLLHSQCLEFSFDQKNIKLESQLPFVFENLEVLQNPELAQWICAAERRFWWLQNSQTLTQNQFIKANQTWRWLHTETPNLRADHLGENILLSWYSEHSPSGSQLKNIESFRAFLDIKLKELNLRPASNYFIQLRTDRGKSPNAFGEIESSTTFPKRWTIKENTVNYELRLDSGLSTGLFLDQRNNRAWVQKHSQQKRVLNLFSYTGGFSVCAALGGASHVTSVDISMNFLEWSKQNFRINSLEPENYEFRKIDSLEYLVWAAKKQIQYDLIICDPPSFARTDKKIFKIDKALPELIASMNKILAPKGQILFCTNFEAMNAVQFLKALKSVTVATVQTQGLRPAPFMMLREDFELPHQEPLMKSFLLEK